MWLGKGLLGESRYKICIVTEAIGGLGASWAGAGRADERAGLAWGARTGAADGWARGSGAQRASGRAEQAARRLWGVGVHSGRDWQARARQVRGSRHRRAQSPRGRAGWAAGTRPGQDSALGALDLIFKSVFRLGIFPKSLNEHCSLQNKFFSKKKKLKSNKF